MATPATPDPSTSARTAGLRQRVLLALWVGPVVLWVGLRWWLQRQVERLPQPLPPALSPASDPASLWLSVVLVALGGLLFGLLAWWLVRKPGPLPRWLLPAAVVVWVVLWLAGSAQALRAQLNVQGVQAAQPQVLRLVGLKPVAPSVRSAGGARLYLDWPAQGGLHTVLIASPSDALLRQPEQVFLHIAPGRWSGWWVTGWSLDGLPPGTPPPASADAPPDKDTP